MPQSPPGSERARRRKRSSSSGAIDNAEEENEDSPASASAAALPLDFGTYMAVKGAKLRVQFDEQRAEKRRRAAEVSSSTLPTTMTSTTTSDIFRGVVIHVNGITVPCALVRRLKRTQRKLCARFWKCIVVFFVEKKGGGEIAKGNYSSLTLRTTSSPSFSQPQKKNTKNRTSRR